ncbi:MAG: sporulation protein YabP [Clostridia bacterium]|nr:sporulation protein YabP [Clostridia bacterium]
MIVEQNGNKTADKEHSVFIDARKSIRLIGVVEVISCQDGIAQLKTNMGNMQIVGSSLRVEKLDLENSLIEIVGNIGGIKYAGSADRKSIFAKLFK